MASPLSPPVASPLGLDSSASLDALLSAPLFLDQVDMRNIMLVDSLIEGRIVTFQSTGSSM